MLKIKQEVELSLPSQERLHRLKIKRLDAEWINKDEERIGFSDQSTNLRNQFGEVSLQIPDVKTGFDPGLRIIDKTAVPGRRLLDVYTTKVCSSAPLQRSWRLASPQLTEIHRYHRRISLRLRTHRRTTTWSRPLRGS